MKPENANATRASRWTISVANWWAVKLIAAFSFGLLAIGCAPLLFAIASLIAGNEVDPKKGVGVAIPLASATVGALGLAFVIRQHRLRERRLAIVDGDASRPWLHREDWAEGVVEPNDGQRIVNATIGVTVCLGIAISVLVLRDWRQNPWEPALLLSFALVGGIGLYSLYQLARCIAGRRRFGKTVLRLATLPGKVGGKFAGVVMAPAAVASSPCIQVRLLCVERYSDGDGGSESIVWKHDVTVARTLAADAPTQVGLPVLFDIPASAIPTDLGGKVTWKLTVAAKRTGLDYHDEFIVPIFRTAIEQPPILLADSFLALHQKPTLDQALGRQRIAVQKLKAGVSYYARPPRSWPLAILFLLIPLLIGGLGIWAVGGFEGAVQAAISVAFLLWMLQFVFVTPPGWFAWSRLTIEKGVWRTESSWFGLEKGSLEFQPEEIDEIDLRHNQRSFFSVALPGADILIRLRSGECATAVLGVTDGATQLALMDELRHLSERALMDAARTSTESETGTESPTEEI